MQSNEILKLLELAESSNVFNKHKKPDVEKYIKKFKIEDGEKFIPCFVIYFHYRSWKKKDYLTKISFFKSFSKYFDVSHDGSQQGYKLNPAPYDITQEGYFRARTFLRKERDAKKVTKKKKSKKTVTK